MVYHDRISNKQKRGAFIKKQKILQSIDVSWANNIRTKNKPDIRCEIPENTNRQLKKKQNQIKTKRNAIQSKC